MGLRHAFSCFCSYLPIWHSRLVLESQVACNEEEEDVEDEEEAVDV